MCKHFQDNKLIWLDLRRQNDRGHGLENVSGIYLYLDVMFEELKHICNHLFLDCSKCISSIEIRYKGECFKICLKNSS